MIPEGIPPGTLIIGISDSYGITFAGTQWAYIQHTIVYRKKMILIAYPTEHNIAMIKAGVRTENEGISNLIFDVHPDDFDLVYQDNESFLATLPKFEEDMIK